MKLYLLRHGLADRSAWQGNDFERPLTTEGRRRLENQARNLARLGVSFAAILSSPLQRAWQTASIVAQGLGLEDVLHTDDRLGAGFGPAALEAILAEMLAQDPDLDSLLLVGHEPGFSETISAVTGGSRIVCKKGSLARIDLERLSPVAGQLIWLVPSRLLAS
jgi:phosphohistidine phosphatase